MIINWLGHASFLIASPHGRIITDPFDKKLGYEEYRQPVDIATVSHQHWDHNAVQHLQGNPTVVSTAGQFEIGQVRITGLESFHDSTGGRERGHNIIFKLTVDGVEMVHLGDLGHVLEPAQIDAIGPVDILFLPVGGVYTIDAQQARVVVKQLQPAIIIPMHYKTRHLSFELEPLEKFTGQFDKTVKKPRLEVSAANLSRLAGVVVLDYPGS